jgi:hypothetical protein
MGSGEGGVRKAGISGYGRAMAALNVATGWCPVVMCWRGCRDEVVLSRPRRLPSPTSTDCELQDHIAVDRVETLVRFMTSLGDIPTTATATNGSVTVLPAELLCPNASPPSPAAPGPNTSFDEAAGLRAT